MDGWVKCLVFGISLHNVLTSNIIRDSCRNTAVFYLAGVDHILPVTPIARFITQSQKQCLGYCLDNSICKAINVNPKQVNGTNCHLLKEDSLSASFQLVYKQNWTYYYTGKPKNMVGPRCREAAKNSLCPSLCQCRDACNRRGYRCNCTTELAKRTQIIKTITFPSQGTQNIYMIWGVLPKVSLSTLSFCGWFRPNITDGVSTQPQKVFGYIPKGLSPPMDNCNFLNMQITRNSIGFHIVGIYIEHRVHLANEWHHFCVTWSLASNITLFYDGEKVLEKKFPTKKSINGGGDMMLGNAYSKGTEQGCTDYQPRVAFSGALTIFTFYNRSLTLTEIKDIRYLDGRDGDFLSWHYIIRQGKPYGTTYTNQIQASFVYLDQ